MLIIVCGRRLLSRLFLLLLLVGFLLGTVAKAADSSFAVPQRLRPRVDFWKDIFTKYGPGHLVFHHREFPQIVFKVVDMTRLRAEYDDKRFFAMKKEIDLEHSADIEKAFRTLAAGAAARTPLEQRIVKVMAPFSGGLAKYQRVVNEGLIRSQTGIRDKFAASIQRSGKYMPMMEEIFVRYGLPKELTRLPFIESSFDYSAYSSVGAAGIWQFMPATARSYMAVGSVVDERRDPVVATHAASKYLMSAYKRLGAWPLAVTSYNHGVAGVARKVSESGSSDLAAIIEHPTERYFGFASSNFYPEFLAAVEVYRDRKRHFPEIKLDAPVHFRTHRMTRSATVKEVSGHFGVDVEELKGVNYALTPKVWQGRYPIPRGFTLRIPTSGSDTKGAVSYATTMPDRVIDVPVEREPRVSPRVEPLSSRYTVQRGDTLDRVAVLHGISVARLKEANRLKGNTIKLGQILTIPPKGYASSAVAAKQPKVTTKSASKAVVKKTSVAAAPRYHTVRRGETLGSIAKRNGVSIKTIQTLNGMGGKTRITVGGKLRVK